MPSEPSLSMDAVLDAVKPGLEDFRSAVAEAHEEIRGWQLEHEAAVSHPASTLESELGLFARGRVDAGRLASLLKAPQAPDSLTHHLMAEARDFFSALMKRGTDAYRISVPRGGDLRDAVRDGLAELGRVFGMAHLVEKARSHTYEPDRDHGLLQPYPFHRWNLLEKELAPPLVVEVDGADLRAAGLVEFLDGAQKLVLVVRGQALPAPLARLISPLVFVAQAEGEAALIRIRELMRREGPGIVGAFEAGAGILPFGQRPGMSMDVDRAVLEEQVKQVSTTRGQPGILDLRHLETLAALPGRVAPESAPPRPEEQTVDRLAAWLLSRTDLSDESSG